MSTGAAASATTAMFSPSRWLKRKAAESYAATYPDMLLSHVADKLNQVTANWDLQREQIRSPAEDEHREPSVPRGHICKHRYHCARYPEPFRLTANSGVAGRKLTMGGPVDPHETCS